MPTPVTLPTQLSNWPELKQKLLALKSNDGKLATILKQLDDAHATMESNFVDLGSKSVKRSFFSGLARFLAEAGQQQQRHFASELLPLLVDRVLALEHSQQQLSYACQQEATVVVLSRDFISSLLAAMFLCVMPPHPPDLRHSMPENTFAYFFGGILPTCPHQSEKVKCVLAYFDQLLKHGPPKGQIAFARSVLEKSQLQDAKSLSNSKQPLCQFTVEQQLGLEAADASLLHVNFGNSFLGGGALRTGALQEELNFMMHPELLACMTFMEAMDDNEAVSAFGHAQFSRMSGTGLSAKFQTAVAEESDAGGIGQRACVSLDAVPFTWSQCDQLAEEHLLRDINKAVVGFRQTFRQCQQLENYSVRGVATGNWGCGAFGGHPQLKSMLQWIAASLCGLPQLVYHSYGNQQLAKLSELVQKLEQQKWTVGQLWREVASACNSAQKQQKDEDRLKLELFDQLLKRL